MAFQERAARGRRIVYRIVRAAVESRRPISAVYHDRHRLFCPHRLGRNKEGQLRALCYQYGGESESGLKPMGSPDNWRCIALDKLKGVELLDGSVANGPQPLTSRILHSRGGCGRRRLSGSRSTAGTLRKQPDQIAGNDDSDGRDRVRIMPLGTYAANRAAGSLAAVSAARNPRWPARAEGEKRLRSATRNPYETMQRVA